MKKILLVLVVISAVVSCKVGNVNDKPEAIIIEEEHDEERPMFTVKLPNGRVLEHMYAEEIAQGLLDGKWTNDETLALTHDYQYQVLLEQDSLHVTCVDRKVAVVGYNQIGVLDSIFIKDNE